LIVIMGDLEATWESFIIESKEAIGYDNLSTFGRIAFWMQCVFQYSVFILIKISEIF
jgi:hypothetical protein